MSRKPRFADEEVVIPTDSFIVGLSDGTEVIVRLGDVYKGSDQVVRERPEWFAPLGTPPEQWTNPAIEAADAAIEAPEPEEPKPAPRVRTKGIRPWAGGGPGR